MRGGEGVASGDLSVNEASSCSHCGGVFKCNEYVCVFAECMRLPVLEECAVFGESDLVFVLAKFLEAIHCPEVNQRVILSVFILPYCMSHCSLWSILLYSSEHEYGL